MTEYRVVKRFDNWTGILNYLNTVAQDATLTDTSYKTEVYYDDEADQYKVYVII